MQLILIVMMKRSQKTGHVKRPLMVLDSNGIGG